MKNRVIYEIENRWHGGHIYFFMQIKSCLIINPQCTLMFYIPNKTLIIFYTPKITNMKKIIIYKMA
ncbi:hypothetical protein CLPU_9c00870 [Gottschalkia purinilytica]|uniref:Uncharacterized protein n=1 Tax=Gottschalkia purinilytica TaxID=1503 RepID=A0A0L0W9S1_GOTPU|nr:hypothetical protein CLPU_9c00870 [Gottschalkia purinilytica]